MFSECQKCACNDVELVNAGTSGGRPWATYRCNYCGAETTIGPMGKNTRREVAYNPVRCRCPRCGADNPATIETRGRVREHRCGKCGQEFTSRES